MAKINPNDVRIDGGTQPRSHIDDSVVDEYAEVMREGGRFPSVVVFFDGASNWRWCLRHGTQYVAVER